MEILSAREPSTSLTSTETCWLLLDRARLACVHGHIIESILSFAIEIPILCFIRNNVPSME